MNRPILIIEDEPALRVLLKEFLEFEGFAVQTASTGAEALDLAQKGPIALAFVDINLPDMTGDEVMRAFQERGQDTKLVILSGNVRESYEARIEDLEVYRVLEKPVDLTVISTLAKEVLGRSAA